MYNQQMHAGQGGLMFNPYQPTSQMVQWPLNSPPTVPNNVQVPPQLTMYYTMICALVANEVTASAGQNPARMFTFNQVSSNNFMNQSYSDLVCIAVDMACKNLAKQPQIPIENHISEGVREALALFVSMNIVEQTGLHSIVDSNVVQNAYTNVNQMHALKNEVTHYKNILNAQAGMQMQGNYSAPMNNHYPHNGNPGVFAINPAFAARAGMNPATNFGGATGPSIFTNDPNSSFANTPNNGAVVNSRYSYANKPAPVQPQVAPVASKYASYPQGTPVHQHTHTTHVTQSATTSVTPEYEIVTADDWVWSLEQPVQDKLFDELLFRIEWRRYHNNGNPVVRSVLIPLTGEEMNKADHEFNTNAKPQDWAKALGNGFDSPAAAHRDFKADTKVTSSVLDLKNHTSAYEAVRAKDTQTNEEQIHSEVSDVRLIDTSVESALIDVVLSCQGEPTNKINRVYVEVAKPIIAKIDDQSTVTQPDFTAVIYDMQFMNFNQVAEQLREWENLGLSQASQVASKLDTILTDKTNSVLRNNLSLSVSIESFMEDIKDLPGYLSNKYGENVAGKFSQSTRFIIQTTMNVLDEAETNLRPDVELDDEQPVGKFISFFLGTIHSANFINCTSSDLGLSKLKKIKTVEDKKLMDVCKDICSCSQNVNTITSVWLLTTSDYSTYKIHKGMLAGNADSFFIEPYKT